MLPNVHREITPLAPADSFLVFDRIKEDFDFPVHFHPEFELNFISNGKGVRRIIGDSMEEIDNLELVIVGGNLEHGWELHNCTNNEIREITIQFHDDLLDTKLLNRRIMKPIRDMFGKSTHGILFSQETIKNITPRILKLSTITSIDYFLELISILHDLATSRNQRLLSNYTSNYKDFENSEKIKVVYDYIQNNYHKKITLAELSNLINMSPVSFNRFIKQRTGRTFIEYLNNTRIGYAARWLIEKDLGIAEIAYNSGFNNIANFNKVFKKIKNTTPSRYRKEFSGIKRIL